MGNLKNYIDSQFFIIDSNNLDDVQSELFGFSMHDGELIYDKDLTDNVELNGDGTYIRILKRENFIEISQDCNGSYGIYLYKNDNCFVISNSFLKLAEYVVDKYPISLNKNVLFSFITADLCALSYRQSMINEIEIVPRTYTLIIDILKKSYHFKKIDYSEQSVPINSIEGINILDNWFYKWISIFRSVARKTNNLQIDLTGGFDSRIVFAILLNANINLNNFLIYSINKEVHKEDYEIASIIAEKYNLELNKPVKKDLIRIDSIEDSLNLTYYTRFCFHKHYSFPSTISSTPIYVTGGFGGATLREYWNRSPEEHIKIVTKNIGKYSENLKKYSINTLEDSFNLLQEDFNIDDSSSVELTQLLYKEVRNRNHFGKMSVDYYLTNQIRLSPLLDQDLYKLKKEGDLLYALIFTRYCPELFNIRFDHGKTLDSNSINKAKEINNRFPFRFTEFNYYIDGPEEFEKKESVKKSNKKFDKNKFIKDVFLSEPFKNKFITYLSEELYDKALNEIKTKTFQPLETANACISVIKIIDLVKINNEVLSKSPANWLNNFLEDEKIHQ